MEEGASAPIRQPLPQGGEGLLLGPLHGHAADLKPLGGLPEREAFQDSEPQGRGLGGRQCCSTRPSTGMHWPARLYRCQLIRQALLEVAMGIEVEMP